MFSLSLVSQEDVRPWSRTKPSHLFLAPWHTDCIPNLQSKSQENLMVQSPPIHELWLHQAWKDIPTLPYLFKPFNYLTERAEWSLQFLWVHQRNRIHFFHVYWLGSFFFSFFQSPNFLYAWFPAPFFVRVREFWRERKKRNIYIYIYIYIYIHTHTHIQIMVLPLGVRLWEKKISPLSLPGHP